MSVRAGDRSPALPLRDALVLVGVGGTLGTALRWLLSVALGSADGLGAGVIAANVVGAFGLGWLLVALERSAVRAVRRERLRLFLGVGLLGAFTTYSAFALSSAQVLADGHVQRALWQAAALVAAGLAAAAAGGAWAHHRADRPVRVEAERG